MIDGSSDMGFIIDKIINLSYKLTPETTQLLHPKFVISSPLQSCAIRIKKGIFIFKI